MERMFKENILVLVQHCNRDSHGAAAYPQESPSLELVPALGPSWATAPAVSASHSGCHGRCRRPRPRSAEDGLRVLGYGAATSTQFFPVRAGQALRRRQATYPVTAADGCGSGGTIPVIFVPPRLGAGGVRVCDSAPRPTSWYTAGGSRCPRARPLSVIRLRLCRAWGCVTGGSVGLRRLSAGHRRSALTPQGKARRSAF